MLDLGSFAEPISEATSHDLTRADIHEAYAVYFDHKRRTDPEFRKALKRESRKEARAAKEEAEAQGAQQKEAIKAAGRSSRDL